MPFFSGLLRPYLCGEEIVRGLETSLGPLPPQCLSEGLTFPYGDPPLSVREALRPGDYAVSMDMLEANFHILIHKRDRKFLRFIWRDRVFQFRALPFDLAPALYIFSKISMELAILVRKKGIRMRMYMDDWLLLAHSRI